MAAFNPSPTWLPRWVLAVLLVPVAASGGCRRQPEPGVDTGVGGSPGASAPGSAVGHLGTPLRTESYIILASAVKECSREAVPPAARAERLGVQLSIEPTGDLQVPANPYYATLVDSAGNVHEATLGGCGTPLAPALPARGQAARGWVVFDVPSGTRGLTLVYAPELVGAQKRDASIALGR